MGRPHCQRSLSTTKLLQKEITDKMDSLKGATLIKADGSKGEADKALENKDLVLYYFSAHWCPPCRQFTTMLSDFYGEVEDDLEIVVRLQRQVARGHDLLHEGVPRRLVWCGAQLGSRQRTEAEVRSSGHPHAGGGEEGRYRGHQGREI